uniref:Serpentine receptor class gamma n=2 Tax=Ditylenchus dipsaci TaxID=166011 RepID=A0A915ER76_9BILA
MRCAPIKMPKLGHSNKSPSNEIWKYFLPVAVIVIFVLPLPFTYQLLSHDFFVRLQQDNYTFTLDFHRLPGVTYWEPSYRAAFSAVLFCIICGILNLLTIWAYNRSIPKQNKQILNKSQKEEQKIESRLTIYAMITFAAQFANALFMILVCISATIFDFDSMFLPVFTQLPWVNDLTTIALNAWVLLWASTNVRQQIAKELKMEKWPIIGAFVLRRTTTATMVMSYSVAVTHP